MNAYDPQARRVRSRPAAVSPIDSLLGDVEEVDVPDQETESPVDDVRDSMPDDATLADTVAEEQVVPDRPDGKVRPFETPPIELTDEHADRLHRFGVLAAIAAILVVLVALRKRRRLR